MRSLKSILIILAILLSFGCGKTLKVKCNLPEKPTSPEIVEKIKAGLSETQPILIEPNPLELVEIFEYIELLEAVYN